MPVSEHQASLQAEREVARQLQQRLQELEGTNAQLMEHNMAMMKGTLLLQQQQQQQNQHQQHYVHESAEEKDNGSVFSIEKSAYQEQVTLLSQQIAVIEQQVCVQSSSVFCDTDCCNNSSATFFPSVICPNVSSYRIANANRPLREGHGCLGRADPAGKKMHGASVHLMCVCL